MSNYFDIFIIICFLLIFHLAGRRISRRYVIKIDGKLIEVKRSLVTQIIDVNNIKKIKVLKGGVRIFGDFVAVDKRGKTRAIKAIEILANGTFDQNILIEVLRSSGASIE